MATFIAFCVFAMLWPSINAAAIVFAGNLPFYLLMPLLLLVGAALSVLSEVIVFRRFRNANPATMMIASFALGFVDPISSADALFEPPEVDRIYGPISACRSNSWVPASRCCKSSRSCITHGRPGWR